MKHNYNGFTPVPTVGITSVEAPPTVAGAHFIGSSGVYGGENV